MDLHFFLFRCYKQSINLLLHSPTHPSEVILHHFIIDVGWNPGNGIFSNLFESFVLVFQVIDLLLEYILRNIRKTNLETGLNRPCFTSIIPDPDNDDDVN